MKKISGWILTVTALLAGAVTAQGQCGSSGHIVFIPNVLQGGWSASCLGGGAASTVPYTGITGITANTTGFLGAADGSASQTAIAAKLGVTPVYGGGAVTANCVPYGTSAGVVTCSPGLLFSDASNIRTLTLLPGSSQAGNPALVIEDANGTTAFQFEKFINSVQEIQAIGNGSVPFALGGNTPTNATATYLWGNSSFVLKWDISASIHNSADTSLSRISAGLIGVGTGAQGSTAGSMSMTNLTASGTITRSGSISAPAWTTGGIGFKSVASTFTDTSSSGTVAAQYSNVFGGSTVAASSATTYTEYDSVHISDPVAGSNVTFTNKYALGVDSLNISGSSFAFNGKTCAIVASAINCT